MSEMKLEEMKKKTIADLHDQVDLWQSEYTKMTFSANLQKKAEKPHKFKLLRKQIARAKTLIKQKQMEGAN